MNSVNSNNRINEQLLKVFNDIVDMTKEEREQFLQLLKEIAKTPGMMDITGITKEQSSHHIDLGVKKLASNSISEGEMSNIVHTSADFVNSAKTQDKINRNKNELGKLADKFKTLSTKNKLLLGGAALATPLLPVIALVALTVAVLGLGGMAIGKGTIKAGKATVHGAQIAGNAVKSGAEAAKRKMSDAAEIIGEKGENAAKRTKHGFKNVIDYVPSRASNIEKFLENASKFSREYGSLSNKSENQVHFIEKYLLEDGKVSDKKVQALENVLNNEVNEFEVQNFHRLMEKGKSTHRDDYKEFKNQLNGLTSLMKDDELQNAFTKELANTEKQKSKSEVKAERAENQPSSFISRVKDRVSNIIVSQQNAR